MFSSKSGWHNVRITQKMCPDLCGESLRVHVNRSTPALCDKTSPKQEPYFFQSPAPQASMQLNLCSGTAHPGFRILKSVAQGEHLVHHETQSCVLQSERCSSALRFQSKITTAFLKYDPHAHRKVQRL